MRLDNYFDYIRQGEAHDAHVASCERTGPHLPNSCQDWIAQNPANVVIDPAQGVQISRLYDYIRLLQKDKSIVIRVGEEARRVAGAILNLNST